MSEPKLPAPAETDRNLLIGVLALPADCIYSPQFVEAYGVWATRREPPLADVRAELDSGQQQVNAAPTGVLRGVVKATGHEPSAPGSSTPRSLPMRCALVIMGWL